MIWLFNDCLLIAKPTVFSKFSIRHQIPLIELSVSKQEGFSFLVTNGKKNYTLIGDSEQMRSEWVWESFSKFSLVSSLFTFLTPLFFQFTGYSIGNGNPRNLKKKSFIVCSANEKVFKLGGLCNLPLQFQETEQSSSLFNLCQLNLLKLCDKKVDGLQVSNSLQGLCQVKILFQKFFFSKFESCWTIFCFLCKLKGITTKKEGK